MRRPRVGTRVGTCDKRNFATVEDTAVPVRRVCSSRHSASIRGLCVLWDARELENEVVTSREVERRRCALPAAPPGDRPGVVEIDRKGLPPAEI